jgi:glycogen debranching enzyme
MADDLLLVHDQYYIQSTSARLDDRKRVLKHGDTFAVFDRYGNIEPFGRNEFGVFHQDTRFVSQLVLRLRWGGGEPRRMLLMNSAVKEDNAILKVHLTNPDLAASEDGGFGQGTVHVMRAQALWRGALCDSVRVHNYGERTVRFALHVACGADFADIFEVRGMHRTRRGRMRAPVVEGATLAFGYRGLDKRERRTLIAFEPPPDSLTTAEAVYELELASHAATTLRWTAQCEDEEGVEEAARSTDAEPAGQPPRYEIAAGQVHDEIVAARAAQPVLRTSNPQVDAWIERSRADLHMLTTRTPHGDYLYAGVPWFSTPFGRDGIIAALQCLWLVPERARGVLSFLAATQATRSSPARDAQPGKILHETRGGEMAAVGEVPFGRYYGSVDSTPLFVMLAGAYHLRTGDLEFMRSLWPHIERALQWIDRYGDPDGDGFVEYARRSPNGLVQQGWKDSHDAVFHDDGKLAEAPVALCEVQGYVYAAKLAASQLAARLGHAPTARVLQAQAEALRARFEEAFWCEDLGTYALALDAQKRPCRVRTSNAGHCLWAGIASADRARRVASTLMSETGFSGWGVRTVASVESRYNPMSYHDGSVWPHDNSIVAAGMARYGLQEQAAGILGGLFDASLCFDLRRLPELFCGFTREAGEDPTQYPQACSPQAWAAGAPLLCLQACLGLEVHAEDGIVRLRSPFLPPFLDRVCIEGLRLTNGSMDLVVTRHTRDVGVRMTRREGPVELQVLM